MRRSNGGSACTRVGVRAAVVTVVAIVALCVAVSFGLGIAYATPEEGDAHVSAAASGSGEEGSGGNGETDGLDEGGATADKRGDGVSDNDGAGVMAARVSANDVPKQVADEEVLAQLAARGIYPGTCEMEDDRAVWTAYDAASPDNASIKATVTLPENITGGEKSYLYIRPVTSEEPYYPTSEEIEAKAKETNDVQCYAIYWVKIYQEDGEWKYDLEEKSVLGQDGDDSKAMVKIEYLKEDACLKGSQAQRKLQVYNSRQEDGSRLEENATPVNVSANDTSYTGFTFETNQGGPYVFVSKHLYEGYVSSLDCTSIIDGSAPFDSDDTDGNDSSDKNNIVRSYDTIQYNLTANFAARSNIVTAEKAEIGFEMVLPADITEAVIDTGKMLWLGQNYTIEYLDADGKVVMTQGPDGTYKDAQGKATSVNGLVSDSNEGTDSYTSSVVSQRLTGTVEASSDDNLLNLLAANQTYVAAVQVLGAKNKSSIQPTFKAWFVGNEDNYGSESGNANDVHLAEVVEENECTPEEVKVSAAARFNLELAKNANVSYKTWFDSERGNEVANVDSYTIGEASVSGKDLYNLLEALGGLEENINKSDPQEFTDGQGQCAQYLKENTTLEDYKEAFGSIRYGRITGYGISLQIHNKAGEGDNVLSKGFKGVSLPQGSINFDLNFKTSITGVVGDIQKDQYYAQLWEYNENIAEDRGNQGKQLYWDYLSSTTYASWAASYNSGSDTERSCYNGGTWSLGSSSEEGYHFTVEGYDFNFLATGLKFPTHKAGDSSASHGYNAYIGTYSTGYVQVLNVMPRKQGGTMTLGTEVTVKNLDVTTTSGANVKTAEDDETGYAHEANVEDNVLPDSIPLYAPGGMTKANAFDKRGLYTAENGDFTSKGYYLGTYFWGTSYDCSAYAGQDITLVGALRINAGDYKIKHANILQLFDSEALSIDSEAGAPKVQCRLQGAKEGETNILYAADPDYKQGYDTNKKEVLAYMNEVREEDLVYYASLDELQKDGYTCVGVMAELRNWSIPGESGYGTSLLIPAKVSQDEKFLGKTVATVNAIRMWTNETDMENGTVTWRNGVYDKITGKNSVEGYTRAVSEGENHRGEVANYEQGDHYVKTEYKDGQAVPGTNTGGYVRGSSLLILGYKSTVGIAVDNGGKGTLPTFDLDKGEYTVNYRVNNIQARTDNVAGSAESTKTDLTVLSKLETSRTEGDTKQRLSVAVDGYAMVPASASMVFVDEKGSKLDNQSAAISSDPANPTTVRYAFVDEKGEIDPDRIYTIQVYAQRDTDGGAVTFTIMGATVDVAVPDITFDALIDPSTAQNNDRIEASAYISGTSDVRAYSTTNGNEDSVTIGITQLKATRLVKAVDREYTELGGVFTYSVSYANGGNETVDEAYVYDLLPDENDTRGSHYDGSAVLRDVAAELSGESDFEDTCIEFYYSTRSYEDLHDVVHAFGASDSSDCNGDAIKAMLGNQDLFKPLGTISSDNDHKFQADASLDQMTEEELTEEMGKVTCVYAVVHNLGGSTTLTIDLTMEGKGNSTGDLYRNTADSWLGDKSAPLVSNMVSTSVLSRAINGVVWEDANLNGARDEGEPLVGNVTCTLFKLDEEKGSYVLCAEDVTGDEISPVVTGDNGAYSFEKLAAGKYIVAFSGNGLEKYKGATTYRVNGEDDATSNDAVALRETAGVMDTQVEAISGIEKADYSYAIAYDLASESEGDSAAVKHTVCPTALHSIDEMVAGNIALTDNVELYANLDCGLVQNAGFELPETGGSGTHWYYLAGGLLLAVGVAGLMTARARKRDSQNSKKFA